MMIDCVAVTLPPWSTYEMPRVYLREWRLHKDLSQTDLAKRMGVTKGEISRLEGGSRRLTVDWLEKIAKAMFIRPQELYEKPHGDPQSLVASPADKAMPRSGRPTLPRAPTRLVIPEDRGPKRSVRGLTTAEPTLLLHEVIDSEMSPTLAPGDGAIVDTTKTAATSGLFLVYELGAEVVRRIQTSPATGAVKVSAESPHFEPYELEGKEIAKLQVVGRVVGRVTGV